MKGKKFKNLLQLILKIIIIIFKILFFFLFISLLLSILINTCFCMPESRSSNPGDGNAGAIISIILIIIGATIAMIYDSKKPPVPDSKPEPLVKIFNGEDDLYKMQKKFPYLFKDYSIPEKDFWDIVFPYSFFFGILGFCIGFYYFNFLGFQDFVEKYQLKMKYNYPRFYKYRYLLIVLFCWSILLFISIYNK